MEAQVKDNFLPGIDADAVPSMLTSMVVSATSVPQRNTPNFVVPPEDKYICVYCKGILRPKVMQTPCGHRLCEMCVPDLFHQSATPFCPGNDDCVDLSITKIYPDIATTKELLRMAVYCAFKNNGCSATVKWNGLQNHEESCGFAKVDCNYPGCNVSVFRSHLKVHQSECQFVPTLCEKCEEFIPKKLLNNDHAIRCKPKAKKCIYSALGCDFEGISIELLQHRKDFEEHHTTLVTSMITELTQAKDFLKEKQEKFLAQLRDFQTHLDNLQSKSADNTKLQEVQKCVANIGENLMNIKECLKHKVDQDQMLEYATKLTEVQSNPRSQDRRLADVERGSEGGGAIGDEISQKIHDVMISLDSYGQRIKEHDIQFRLLETADYNGQMIWKITNYSQRKQDALQGRVISVYSQPFYTSRYGYRMCARAYLNGDGMGRGTHLSLFFVIMRGDYDALLRWPFRQKVTLSLLDQSASRRHIRDTFRPDPTSSSFRRPVSEINTASGSPLFVSQGTAESDSYLKDDTIFINVSVDISDLSDAVQ